MIKKTKTSSTHLGFGPRFRFQTPQRQIDDHSSLFHVATRLVICDSRMNSKVDHFLSQKPHLNKPVLSRSLPLYPPPHLPSRQVSTWPTLRVGVELRVIQWDRVTNEIPFLAGHKVQKVRVLREVRRKPLHRISFSLQRELDNSSVQEGQNEAWAQGTKRPKKRSVHWTSF